MSGQNLKSSSPTRTYDSIKAPAPATTSDATINFIYDERIINETDLIQNDRNTADGRSASGVANGAVKKPRGTSNMETLMHIIKANIGTGVLAMPLAFKNGGLALSSVGIWVMAVICIHCMHILLNCYKHVMGIYAKQFEEERPGSTVGYQDVVMFVFREKFSPQSLVPKFAKFVLSLFMVIGQLGFCCVYIVFVPTNVKQVVDYYHPGNSFTVELLMCMTLVPLIPFCLIKNLKILAPFSTFANFLMIFSMGIILVELFVYGSLKPMSELDMVAPYHYWPIYFSSAIYAFEGISLVLPVYHEMRNKSAFSPWNGVLNTGMTLVAVMYFSIGFFGYMKYGSDAAASITLNLPTESVLFQAIKIFFAVAIFISYNLQFYVAADIIWSSIYHSNKYLRSINSNSSLLHLTSNEKLVAVKRSRFTLYNLIENLFRSLLVLFTFMLAIKVPRIDLFISLVGAVSGSTLAIIIPPVLDLIVFWGDAKSPLRLFKNLIIIIFGIYIFGAGTYISVQNIIDYLKEN